MILQNAPPTITEKLLAVGIFLLPALSLTAPSGYSFASIIILLAAIVHQFVIRDNYLPISHITGPGKLIILFFLLYAAFWIGDAAVRGEGVRGFDRPSRFVFASFCLMIIARTRIQPSWLWIGLSLGCIGAGGIAVWQVLIEGSSRASGFAQTNKFGIIAILMGLMCITGLAWAHELPRSRLQRVTALLLLCVGAVSGIAASFLSGSRGALFAMVPAIFAGIWALRQTRHATRYLLPGLVALATSAIALAYLIHITGIDSRIVIGIQQLQGYINGDSTQGSIGLRLEMWKGAAHLFSERPIIGWGEIAYAERMHELGQVGVINPSTSRFAHTHNDWMNVLAKKGIIGGVILLGTYGVPFLYYIRVARKSSAAGKQDRSSFALAMAGVIFSSGFAAGGVSQVSFSHNIGVMVYAFMVAVLTGILEAKNRPHEARQSGHYPLNRE